MARHHGLRIMLGLAVLGTLACGLPFVAQDDVDNTANQTPVSSSAVPTYPPATGDDVPRANIVNDEGGPVVITGSIQYTNPFFTAGVASPVIILEDQAGFVDRDENYIMPVESQTIGQITSDFFTSPFSYSLSLPLEPQGSLRDVDFDGLNEPGVMVFAIAYWTNTWGDPFLEERDLGGGGWSTAYASTRISDDPLPEQEKEIVGGVIVVYAPDDAQSFPAGFGTDRLLFTEDDPTVGLPQGYTLVNMDSDPFVFDRSREPVVDLVEPSGAALVDFSGLSYTEAFKAMVDKMSLEYAFTEYKNIDWEALYTEFRPRFEDAERQRSESLYGFALRDFLWRIPDGHVNAPWTPSVAATFREELGGGIGLTIRELTDGRVIAVIIIPGSPAAEAGIESGAEILAIQGDGVQEYLDNITPWLGPFSTQHVLHLNQLRQAVRFPVNTQVEIRYQNPGAGTRTAVLRAVSEIDSWQAGVVGSPRTGYELPVDYELLPSGHLYVQINSFFDNHLLSIQVWERMIQDLNEKGAAGLIIDLRQNGGGSGYMADQMAAYFFDEELELGNTAYYSESREMFYLDPEGIERFVLPQADLRYDGPIAILVGPNCASACEFFAYNMTLQGRAIVVGHYPTAGLGGSVEDFDMPEGLRVRFTIGRSLDSNGNIHIEGRGVTPDIVVPVTTEAVLSGEDEELEAALEALR